MKSSSHRTKRCCPPKELFRLIDADTGRPIADLAPRFADVNLARDTVLRTQHPIERQVETIDRRAWYLLRILPYRTRDLEQVSTGAVVTLAEITRSNEPRPSANGSSGSFARRTSSSAPI